MKTNIYIDGFNFYYGCVKNTQYKWLDFKALCNKLLNPEHEIKKIKYFTAKVDGRRDSRQPFRQSIYLQALKAWIPEIEVYFGHFKSHAVHILNDAWLGAYDCAVLISNDSDIAEALCLVKKQNKKIGLFVPDRAYTSKSLSKHTDFIKKIRKGVLKKSQLPETIPGTNLHKPDSW